MADSKRPSVRDSRRALALDSRRPPASLRSPGDTGRIAFYTLTPQIIELVWSGYITEASCGHYPDQLIRFLAGRSIRYAIFDAMAVTGFTADSRVPGGALLAQCKRSGARRVIVVTKSSAVRMIGSTVALATGMSIRFVASREAALAEIRRLEREA